MSEKINIDSILDSLVQNLDEIPVNKKYWLIRTQSGSLYNTFRDNNFVGLEHVEISLKELSAVRKFSSDDITFNNTIKAHLTNYYDNINIDEEITIQKIGLIAGQISRFYNKVKKGDVIIIPSINSDLVSFGTIKESNIAKFTDEEKRKLDFDGFLSKRVEWVAEYNKRNLDPNLFKMLTSHQAITDVSSFAEIIERSLTDFFIIDKEAHIIINVATQKDIKAKELFGLGFNLLEIIDDFSREYNLVNVSSNDIDVTVNLNSPGKIDLKSSIKKTSVIAGLILLVVGGGYVSPSGASLKTDGLPGLLKAISDYWDKKNQRDNSNKIVNQEIELKKQIFETYKDSLDVKNPDDMLKLLKQVSSNKDNPK